MGYTHFDKVSGETGLGVGVKGSEVVVANSEGALHQAGTEVTATAAELNIMDDIAATTAELNAVADASARIVTLTAATNITKALHANKICLLSLLTGFQATLPEANGSGDIYTFKIGIVNTSGSYIIAAKTTDTMSGLAMMQEATGGTMLGWLIDGTDDKLTINGTTTGGETIGDTIICVDAQDAVWHVLCYLTGSGTEATPASATT